MSRGENLHLDHGLKVFFNILDWYQLLSTLIATYDYGSENVWKLYKMPDVLVASGAASEDWNNGRDRWSVMLQSDQVRGDCGDLGCKVELE